MATVMVPQSPQTIYQSRQHSAGRNVYSSNAYNSQSLTSLDTSSSVWPGAHPHSSNRTRELASPASDIVSPLSSSSSRTCDSRRTPRRLSKPGPASSTPSYTSEPFPSFTPAPPRKSSSSTSRGSASNIKPYLRKMSSMKTSNDDADQGRLDLSKPISENAALNALDSHDLNSRGSSDGIFTPSSRSMHSRTISGGSQISVGSNNTGSYRPFVHPMRQTPRPYSPATETASRASTEEQDEDEDEQADQFDAAPRPAYARTTRSLSIASSTSNNFSIGQQQQQQASQSRLTQIQTAPDLDYITHTTTNPYSQGQSNAASKSNPSLHSTKSASRSRLVPRFMAPKLQTSTSFTPSEDAITMTSPISPVSAKAANASRSSLDKAFSFASPTSSAARLESASMTQDERVQAARRAFAEREASKERKLASRSRRGSSAAAVANGVADGDVAAMRERSQSGESRDPSFDGARRVEEAAVPGVSSGGERRRRRRASSGLGKSVMTCGAEDDGAGGKLDGEKGSAARIELQTKPYADAVPAEQPRSAEEIELVDDHGDVGYGGLVEEKAGFRTIVSSEEGEHHHHRRQQKHRSTRERERKGKDLGGERKGLNGWVRFSTWAQTRMHACSN